VLQKLLVSVHVRTPGVVVSGTQGTVAEDGDEDGGCETVPVGTAGGVAAGGDATGGDATGGDAAGTAGVVTAGGGTTAVSASDYTLMSFDSGHSRVEVLVGLIH